MSEDMSARVQAFDAERREELPSSDNRQDRGSI